MMSRLLKRLKRIWANVWVRSLIELILISVGGVVLMLYLQTSEEGLKTIQTVKEMMGLPVVE